MKKLSVTVLFLITSLVVGAQENVQEDIIFIYMRKGMRLEGKLLEFEPGEYVLIETEKGHIIKVADDRIKRYYYPGSHGSTKDFLFEKGYIFKEKGMYQYATLGTIMNTVSSNDGGRVGFQMTASAGYQFSRLLGAGLGIGADFYRTGASEMVFPVFGEARGYFIAQPSTPYYVVRTGYGFATANDLGIHTATGGWMFNPAVGWRLGGGKGLKMTIDVGLHFQNAEFDYSRGEETSIAKVKYKRLNMRLGFLF